MATEKQIAANQLNALKSTGPRTDKGKDISSGNALTHGLRARKTIVLDDENEAEFLVLQQSLRAYYDPSGPVEQLFVDTLAAHFWRLQRIPKFEAILLQAPCPRALRTEEQGADKSAAEETSAEETGAEETSANRPGADIDPVVRQLLALQEFMLPKDVFGKISRHEAHLLREIHKILQALGSTKARSAQVAMAASGPASASPVSPPLPSPSSTALPSLVSTSKAQDPHDDSYDRILRSMSQPRGIPQ